ncbi:hypothetical protein [Sporolactobacillus nakayamae]|uniref:Serine aminopeptidase, S33 n=1 Tax=Sporolactobacillus nakayamae TaxID=269670 RepID=A0A1I2V2X1_9BACL|nr:hypothetical protein [Sporolactobacillus nakayamae]SFG83678.1 hypothetical protein SAMN02982927_02934 [Sporolactobacillus nakayamae]
MAQEQVDVFYRYDPRYQSIINAAPQLLMYGDHDQIVSIDGEKDYYKYMNGQPDSEIDLEVYEHVNHEFTDQMYDDLRTWLKRYDK